MKGAVATDVRRHEKKILWCLGSTSDSAKLKAERAATGSAGQVGKDSSHRPYGYTKKFDSIL